MSLFSVLKYPISCPPTLEELNALPETIYGKWTRHLYCSWSPYQALSKERDRVFSWMKNEFNYAGNEIIIIKDLQLLRKIIEEHDELI